MITKNTSEIIDSIVNHITTQYQMISPQDIKADSLLSVMIEAMALEISSMYSDIDRVENQNAVSTASSTYLNLIGNTVGAYRSTNQDDESYRYDIVNFIRNSRTSSKSAVEKVIRDNPNIYNYSIENLAYGAGSFAVHVQVKDNANVEIVVAGLEESINEVVAEGVYFKIIYPKDVNVAVTMTVVGIIDSVSLSMMKSAARSYITGVQSGQVMYRSNIEAAVKGSSDKITTVRITSLKIDGKTAYGSEIKLLIDEEFRIDNALIIFEQ